MPLHNRCRICKTALPEPFLDLGTMPLANAFLSTEREFAQEASYPLSVASCSSCGLVQLTYVVDAEQLFRRYRYVSSTSETVRRYAGELAEELVRGYRWGPSDLVVELGSNDGLVLKEFQGRGVRVLGVEPARNVAAIARSQGVPTVDEFFCDRTAESLLKEWGSASAILGRHVFAHIDDLHDFFQGVSKLLAPEGVLLIEVPYLGNLIAKMQFDTIYHEHLSYVSLKPVLTLCEPFGFQLVDVQPVALHGGSILLTIRRKDMGLATHSRLEQMLKEEEERRLTDPQNLKAFASRVFQWREGFVQWIDQMIRSGAHLVGFGAAAKANTLLNFCPTVAQALSCILDRSCHKHGLYTPGTHRRVVDPERWATNGATHMLVLAWNFKEEIMAQMQPFARGGGRFIIPIPHPEVV